MSTGGGITTIFEVLYLSFRDTLNQNHQLHAGLSQTYWDNFCSTCHFEEGALSLLDEVKDHYKLGIISNGISDAQNKRLQTGGVKDWFQAIIVSDEAGFRKPNKSIFDLALKQMNAARDEVLFIGDSLIYDYEGAMNSGIDFCFYNRKKEEVPSEIKPKYIVHELRELNELLRRL
ncbi:Pyrimidine 5'-nucleotidase YjjG [compost metagenome]